MSVLRERVTWVWLALVVLTVVTTWGLSKDLFSPAVAVVGIFLIAAVKVRYVMLDFMELRDAPDPGAGRLRGLALRGGGDNSGLLVRHWRQPVEQVDGRKTFRK